jgi:SAM-dependent methyltransferase
MDSRVEREREFHDRAFADDVRAPAKRFYSVTRALSRWYGEELNLSPANGRALEYGCGRGSRAFDLARRGTSVCGIDISRVAIEQATERGRAEGLEDRLEFRVMDAEQLEFSDESFDLVCGSGILHHLNLERAYSEIARVLKPSGMAVFDEPLGHNPAINAYRRRTPELRTVDEHPLLMRDLTLAERFFGDVTTRFFTLTALVAVPLRDRQGFAPLLNFLDRLDAALFRAIPALRRNAWMVGMTLRQPRRGARVDISSPAGDSPPSGSSAA